MKKLFLILNLVCLLIVFQGSVLAFNDYSQTKGDLSIFKLNDTLEVFNDKIEYLKANDMLISIEPIEFVTAFKVTFKSSPDSNDKGCWQTAMFFSPDKNKEVLNTINITWHFKSYNSLTNSVNDFVSHTKYRSEYVLTQTQYTRNMLNNGETKIAKYKKDNGSYIFITANYYESFYNLSCSITREKNYF